MYVFKFEFTAIFLITFYANNKAFPANDPEETDYEEETSTCGNNMFYDYNTENCVCDSKISEVPLIFHPNTNQCYFVNEQAYCRSQQWLVINADKSFRCRTNPCHSFIQNLLDRGEEVQRVVYVNNKCVFLGSPCSTRNGRNQELDGIIKYEDMVAKCIKPLSINSPTGSNLFCKTGERYTYKYGCVKDYYSKPIKKMKPPSRRP